MPAVTQTWTHDLPFMQQTVLLLALRGPDNVPKYGPPKMLLRWMRRCILISALDGEVLTDPYDQRGGSFTGPSFGDDGDAANQIFDIEFNQTHVPEYIQALDAIPRHFHLKFMQTCEILGYKHPHPRIRKFWHELYVRLVKEMHLHPETEAELDKRLGDNRAGWLARADDATKA